MLLFDVIPASPDPDTSPVSGRDGGPARPCARSQGRKCARPASEGSFDEFSSKLNGIAVAAHIVLLRIHVTFFNLKAWAKGVYHGLRKPHLQTDLD
jgi:hypothetical protein